MDLDIKKLYQEFIDYNLINNVNDLIDILENFPYYYKIDKHPDIDLLKIRKTDRTDLYQSVQEEYQKYKNILTNMVINKYNHMDFYYFGKEKKEINEKELYSILNRDIKLKNFSFYKYNDNIEYHLCYINNKWSITTKNQLDIYSIEKKSLFETYTLYELFFKALSMHKIELNNIDKNYNYIITLNTPESYLTVQENHHINFQIIGIINRKTNKEIEITKKNLRKFQLLTLNAPLKIFFEDIFHFKKDIKLSHNQRLIIKNNETNEKYIYNYPKFNIRYIILKKFNNDPIQNIKELLYEERINILINLFPIYTYFINNFRNLINDKIEYLMKRYIQIYIKKDFAGEYLPYDQELLLKIHLVYRRTKRKIKNDDIRYILLKLDTKKINKIFNINYQLSE